MIRHTLLSSIFFFFNDTATTEIYTLSLHDALPICRPARARGDGAAQRVCPHRPRGHPRMSEAVFVEAPARLHFGVLDLRGDLGRRFGGIGAAGAGPSVLLLGRPGTAPQAQGARPAAARAALGSAAVPRYVALRRRGAAGKTRARR